MAKKLFIPGPTDVSEDVAARMALPMVGHRSPEYAKDHKICVDGLKKILLTENNVFIGPMSSSGWMEAAVRNCVDKKALHVVNGAFSGRWAKMSEMNGKEFDKVDIEWGSAAKPEDVEEKLNSGAYDTFFITHNETSTGAMTPLEGFGEICKDNNVIFCVDAVSSAAGVKIETDRLDIDVLVTGTQKCFAVAPGLAMTAVSDAAIERSKTVPNRGLYFDYQDILKKAEKDNTPSTPPIPQIRALGYQCQKILEEGLENRWERHHLMAEYVRGWINKNWESYTEAWCASDTVSCAKNTRDFDLIKLGAELSDRGYQFSKGYGKLKSEAFRVAHMGDRQMSEVKEYLSEIDDIVGV